MWKMPNGDVVCSIVFNPGFSPNSKNDQSKKYGKVGEMATWPATRFLNHIGAKAVPGFQLKYVYFLNEDAKKRLTVPILPFSKIDEMGAGMYKGKKITLAERRKCDNSITANAADFQSAEGGQHDLVAL